MLLITMYLPIVKVVVLTNILDFVEDIFIKIIYLNLPVDHDIILLS